MNEWAIGLASGFWLGILTSISPCPLATNIAAVSFVGRRVERPRAVLAAGAIYTLGRMLAYVAIAALLVASLLSAVDVSNVLQKYANKVLGPLLVLVGMLLLDLIEIPSFGASIGASMQKRAEGAGVWGAGLLGIAFALSFCPVSAALYFGSLIPLALKHGSSVGIPAVYGLGTGLPVFVFAVLLSLGAKQVGKAFEQVGKVERWARFATGVVFMGIGIYTSLVFIFGVLA